MGTFFTASAFTIWGLFPLYIKAASIASPGEMLAHRIVWSVVFVGMILVARGQWSWIKGAFRNPALLGKVALSAGLLGLNWVTYVLAVQHNQVVDASLGYFINPLLSVLIGFLVLKERLRPLQWLAVAMAAAGVAWLTLQAGKLPWIAIILATTFAFYGLLRKTADLGSLEGLALESTLVAPLGIAYLCWGALQGATAFANASVGTQLLLFGSGPITVVPLLLFAAGARRIPLSAVGLLQFIAPSIQLGTGVLLYGEPFGRDKLIGFLFIWAALLLYVTDIAGKAFSANRVAHERDR